MLGATAIIYLLHGSLRLVTSYTVRTPQISVLSPTGIRFEIDDPTPGVRLIAYHYSVNAKVLGVQAGQYNVDVQPLDGQFVHENRLVTVNNGDTVYYWVNAIYDNGASTLDYLLVDQQWTYNAAVIVSTTPKPFPTLPPLPSPPPPPPPPQTLEPRATTAPPKPLPPQTLPPPVPLSTGCQASNCTAADVSILPLIPAVGTSSSSSSNPGATNSRPGAASATTPTAPANSTSTAAMPAGHHGLTTTTTIILAVAIVCAAALAVVLAVFFTWRARRIAKTQLPNRPSRPSRSTAWAPPRPAELTCEDPDKVVAIGSRTEVVPSPSTAWASSRPADPIYEDPDKMVASSMCREAAREDSWPGQSHLSAPEARSRARIPQPPHREYQTPAPASREPSTGYFTPVADLRTSARPLSASEG